MDLKHNLKTKVLCSLRLKYVLSYRQSCSQGALLQGGENDKKASGFPYPFKLSLTSSHSVICLSSSSRVLCQFPFPYHWWSILSKHSCCTTLMCIFFLPVSLLAHFLQAHTTTPIHFPISKPIQSCLPWCFPSKNRSPQPVY